MDIVPIYDEKLVLPLMLNFSLSLISKREHAVIKILDTISLKEIILHLKNPVIFVLIFFNEMLVNTVRYCSFRFVSFNFDPSVALL